MNKDLRNAAKNYLAIDIKMFDNKDNNTNDREKEDKEKSKDNMYVSMADLYSHVFAITCMR